MKTAGLLLCFLFILSFSACNKNTPKTVAKKFLNGFYHMDYDAAKSVATEEGKKTIEMTEDIMKQTGFDKSSIAAVEIKIRDVKEEGNKAVVSYVTSLRPETQQLTLINQKGKWLVEWNVNNFFGGNAIIPSEPLPEPLPAIGDSVIARD